MKSIDLGFNLYTEDFRFLDEMVAGGTSDDLSPRSGDISSDDHTNYSVAIRSGISSETVQILDYIDSI